jgi:hypothetical protein
MASDKLNPMKLGVSLGIIWGLLMFITALFGYFTGNPNLLLVSAFQDYYIGYDVTILGALLGFFWGFIDLFLVGIIWAYIYNWLNDFKWFKKWD